MLALGPDGHALAGWPYVLGPKRGVDGAACSRAPGGVTFQVGECWLDFVAGGVLRLGRIAGGTVGEACLRPDGKAVACVAG